MKRRLFLASVATATASATAGCVAGILEDVTTFSASPAEVDEDVADDAGYVHRGTEEWVENREFAGQTVEVANFVAEYTRTIEMPALGEYDAGVFATIASPQVGVADQQFNPLDEMENEEIVEEIQGQYDGLSVGDSVDVRHVAALGSTVEVETFEGSATLAGDHDIDVYVDIATPDHDGDHLVLVGIYPDDEVGDTGISVSDERDRSTSMFEGVEHGD